MKAILLLSFLCGSVLGNDVLSAPIQAKKIVQVSGQVKKSGSIEITSEMTALQAIKAAGGPTELGTIKRVTVLRDGKGTLHNFSKEAEKDLKVEEGDLIEVLTVCIGVLGPGPLQK